jgi:hypothetical protein
MRERVSHFAKDLAEASHKQKVTVAGMITRIRMTTTRKNNQQMAFVTIEDIQGSIELIVFPKAWEKYSALVQMEAVITAAGSVDAEGAEPKVLVDSISLLREEDLRNYQEKKARQEDELPEGAHETGDERYRREHPDGDVHRLLGAPLVGEEPGKELGNAISEKEDRPEPADLDGVEAQVFLDVGQKGQNADAVKVVDEIKQPYDEEDYPAVSPCFLSYSLCSLSHLPPPLDVSCGTGPLVSLPPRRDAP